MSENKSSVQKSIFLNRIKQVQDQLKQHSFDGIIIPPSSDLFYLTGRSLTPGRSFSALLISPDHHLWLSVDSYGSKDPFLLAAQWFQNPHAIAVQPSIPGGWLLQLQNAMPSCKWYTCKDLLSSLRMLKDLEESSLIKTAQHMTEAAIEEVVKIGLAGKTEQQVARMLMDIRLDMGFHSVGMGLIASGPNTAFVHHNPGKRVIREGDVVTIDIGGEYEGYHADMTRSFVIGKASQQIKEIYEIVLNAFQAAVQSASLGVSCQQIDQAGRQMISKAGYGAYFPHGLGHGIGLDVHEEPFLSASSGQELQPGMVFSIEPGIYLPGLFGIRIEDLFSVQEDGTILCLNSMSRKLMEIS